MTNDSIVLGSLALGCLLELAVAVVPTLRRRTTARWIRRQNLPVAAGGLMNLILFAMVGQVALHGADSPPTRRWRGVLATDPGAGVG